MRRLLLASAVALGFAGTANASGLIELNQTTTPPSVGDATGLVNPPIQTAFSVPKNNPDPGKVIIRLDGLVAWDTGFTSSGGNQGRVFTGGVQTGVGKLDAFQNNGYFRLYFGFDGKLLNGIIYGASAEMRTIFAGGTPPGYSAASTATGVQPIGNASANTNASLWFTRRAYGYVGTPTLGLLRFGQGDGPLSIFTGGGITTGEAFDTGAWDGDVEDLMPGNLYGGWAFNDTGNEYTSNKLTYISPTWFGLNVGLSFAPNSCVLSPDNNGNASGGAACNQSSSTISNDFGRPRNIIEAAVRWQGSLGPVAVDAMAGYLHSATVNNGNFGVAGGTRFKGVDELDAGASATFLGASIFGHVVGGTVNGVVTPVAIGPRGAPKQWTWVAGAQYAVGPWTVGASYWYLNKAGSAGGLGNYNFRGEAVGGYYEFTNGFDVFVGYLHGEQRQAGVNFVDTGGPSTAGNHVTTNGVALTMLMRW